MLTDAKLQSFTNRYVIRIPDKLTIFVEKSQRK